MSNLYLTPAVAALIFFGVVVCGHNFRKAWKEQPPGWQKRAWLFGVPAAIGLLALGFLPLKV
ncbi:conserved hypothetical protein [Ruegeria lacuscaerulensis ITI-1157]|nr:conserved hypothetical protein [Ruegeria lacuscaerulensis ITI-1157]SHJ73596.1 hypothetical protein SAMN05444404_2531 [Ruegeria lacuscaerulensis ITI-1157]